MKQGKAWVMTARAESGALAKPHAWSRNKHEGYNLKWQVRFIEEHLADIRRFGEILASRKERTMAEPARHAEPPGNIIIPDFDGLEMKVFQSC